MEDIEATLQKSASLVREIVLTFVGAGIQTLLSLDSIRQFIQSMLNGNPTFQLGNYLIEASYVLITVVYCIGASLAFSPKRIVNPLWVQLLTLVFSILIVSEGVASSSSFALNQYLSFYHLTVSSVIGGLGLIYGMFMVVIGLMQWVVVRSLVGLNGGEAGLDKMTYSFDLDFKSIAKSVKNKDFQSVGSLVVRQETTELLLLSNYAGGSGDKLVLCLSPHPDDSGKTLLATVAYHASGFSLGKSDSASAWMKSVRLYLEDAIGHKGTEVSGESAPLALAVSFALRRTRASVASVRDIPRYYLFAIGLTLLLALAFSLSYFWYGVITETEYTDALALILVALLVELGPAVAESLRKKKEPT